jgi:hypothetical protein
MVEPGFAVDPPLRERSSTALECPQQVENGWSTDPAQVACFTVATLSLAFSLGLL